MESIKDPRRSFVVALIAALLLLALSGCAPMTEQYWSDRYASMTDEELEAARLLGVTVNDIWIDAQTHSRLVCFDGDCVVVQVW